MSLDKRPRVYGSVILDQSKRLLCPFLFWVVFYAFYRLIKASYFGYEDAIWAQLGSPTAWLGYIILGNVQYHMHFLPTLFGMVLLYPVCLIAIDKPWIGLLVILCLFTKREVDIWLWSHMKMIPAADYVLRFVKVITYLGYGFVAASALGVYKKIGRSDEIFQYFKPILFVGFIFYLLKIIYSFRVIEYGNWQFGFAPGFWADFLMPVILFFLFISSRTINRLTWLSRLAPYSFGLYLIHPVFLDLTEIVLWDIRLNPTLFVVLKMASAMFMSSITVVILSRTTGIAWIVGLGTFPKLSQISSFVRSK